MCSQIPTVAAKIPDKFINAFVVVAINREQHAVGVLVEKRDFIVKFLVFVSERIKCVHVFFVHNKRDCSKFCFHNISFFKHVFIRLLTICK